MPAGRIRADGAADAAETRPIRRRRGARADFALAMLKRGMTATLCLNNMWQWSGGCSICSVGDQAPPVMRIDAKDQDWRNQDFTSRFYEVKKARELSYNHMRVRAPQAQRQGVVPRRPGDHGVAARQRAARAEPAAGVPRVDRRGDRRLRREDCAHLVTVGNEGRHRGHREQRPRGRPPARRLYDDCLAPELELVQPGEA